MKMFTFVLNSTDP